ncbi:MAG: hypothetical protein A2Y77_17830 [Planctomycetes bacterium RBG_13_62_9]|nr:MAG: hypothetical protein A2Y77_17830 [Planctomycetes bacterium RBG_13_62_9]
MIILLIVVLAGTVAWGGQSNTRFASCIVRITVDPAIMPLNMETIEGLLHSSAVLVKAGREVLSLNKPEDFARPLITVEWLNASSAPMSPAVRSSRPAEREGYDAEMMRQMEQIYGADYLRQMNEEEYDEGLIRQMEQIYGPGYQQQMKGAPDEQKKGGTKDDRPGGSRQRDGASGPSRQGRSENTRTREPGGGMYGMGTRSGGGGMGGMMGGMMSGMGGYGASSGGMMGGYGGMGGMDFYYGMPGAAQQDTNIEQSATIRLYVSLPEDVPPLADEFLREVIGNLRNSLSYAYGLRLSDLQDSLHHAEGRQQSVQTALETAAEDASPAARKVKEQLSTVVDLSAISPQMPISGAVDVLRKAVDPPLNIVVLWNDLSMHLRVEPTTPANIDGMPRIRLETALDLLVKGLPNPMGKAGPIWKIKDDVIVIGTLLTLEESRASARKPDVETDVRALAAQRTELTRKVQNQELDLASMDARREAIGKQIASIERQVDERLSRDTVTQELEKLAQIYTKSTQDAAGRLISPDSPEAREKVIRARIELASRREELSRQAGGGQLEEFNKELSRMAVDQAERRAQLGILNDQLQGVQRQLAQASVFDPQAARTRIAQEALDIAERRVVELQRRISNLQPPMVAMIGAN